MLLVLTPFWWAALQMPAVLSLSKVGPQVPTDFWVATLLEDGCAVVCRVWGTTRKATQGRDKVTWVSCAQADLEVRGDLHRLEGELLLPDRVGLPHGYTCALHLVLTLHTPIGPLLLLQRSLCCPHHAEHSIMPAVKQSSLQMTWCTSCCQLFCKKQ